MNDLEPKKLSLLRILQILTEYSDYDHPLKQEDIIALLDSEYGITLERKAIGRNISLLKEAGIEIESDKRGSYLIERKFEDSELRLMIDSVLASRHISVKHSKEIIEKLSSLSNKYFHRHIKHVYSVNEWSKTENKTLFYNIDLIDEAIESGKMVEYDYNKYGVDKELHKSSFQRISPYQLILHNQRYYLMGYSDFWDHIVFHRLDRITNMVISNQKIVPINDVKGFENGIDYNRISTAMPYMYTDEPEVVTFIARKDSMDQIIDWFGKKITVEERENDILVSVRASPKAMVYWALQYADCVEVVSPLSVRKQITDILSFAADNYKENKK